MFCLTGPASTSLDSNKCFLFKDKRIQVAKRNSDLFLTASQPHSQAEATVSGIVFPVNTPPSKLLGSGFTISDSASSCFTTMSVFWIRQCSWTFIYSVTTPDKNGQGASYQQDRAWWLRRMQSIIIENRHWLRMEHLAFSHWMLLSTTLESNRCFSSWNCTIILDCPYNFSCGSLVLAERTLDERSFALFLMFQWTEFGTLTH